MTALAKLLLIDAHALIHRAYHAIPPTLTSVHGEPTNATYGFASTLLKVFADEHPDYVVAAFDVGAPTRIQKFADYKATRPELADDLAPQIARARQVCHAFGIPTFGVQGYEADDLIGTLATQAESGGLETVIVTGDTDTFQLIDSHTRVLTFSRQFGETILYDHHRVKDRYGLEPKQLIDLKALRGDASDNVPGVPGVGDKTATKLLQTFGSVEGIYQNLEQLDSKTRDKLAGHAKQVELSKELVTIDCDAPVQLDLDLARFGEFAREPLQGLFRELGFRSLLGRVEEVFGAAPGATGEALPAEDLTAVKANYATVDTEAKVQALLRTIRRKKAFVVDVETTDLNAMLADLVGLAIGVGNGEAYYIPLGHVEPPAPLPEPALKQKGKSAKKAKEAQATFFEGGQDGAGPAPEPLLSPAAAPGQLDRKAVMAALGPLLADPKIEKYAHNAKYDMLVLEQHGAPLRPMSFDTLTAAHLVEPTGQALGLKSLAWSKFGIQMTEIEGLIGKGKNQLSMSQVPIVQVTSYAGADADYTYRLVDLYREQLKERGLEKIFYEVEMPLVPVLVAMEKAGVLLDLAALRELSTVLGDKMSALEAEIFSQCGGAFNLASPAQLSEALFTRLKLSPAGLARTRTGQISTAADVLDTLRDKHPVIGLILEHRELSKLKGTYVDALPQLVNPKTGRVHTSYNQTGAVTGRLSSSNPNLQNIPVRSDLGRLVRRAFIAAPGHVLVSADYSQVELRILAHITQDENLLEAFGRGEDIHKATASLLFDVPVDQVTPRMRDLGKRINFGVVYGISDWGIATRTDLSVEDSRKLIASYFQKYPRVQEYVERTKREAREKGYVQTILGRYRYFPELASGARVNIAVRNASEREAINMPIQGSAADIIKIAMVQLDEALGKHKLEARLILQVHDELVLETPEGQVDEVARLTCDVMENAYPLATRLKTDVKVGRNWDQMTEHKAGH